MRTIKKITVLLIYLLVEAFLLAILLGALILPFPVFIRSFHGVWATALAVGVVLYLHGYYLTRGLAGVAPRSRRWWFYPAIAAMLFVAHTHFAFARSKSDLSPLARAIELPFLAGGACLVFVCAFLGNWYLRKWTRTESNGGGWPPGGPTPECQERVLV
jgi:hypothetical protein